ncbi:MAG: ferritin family protein [Candidatus Omnitrophica bacterium]|nr:ferritin family protein [Candidatus Omnitrophota bacterium]MDD5238774.1 ferritin family protein [Candidatus Omnitrophota bacterium]
MGNIFAGSEIVEIGIQIEKNGRDFYNTLVKKSENKEAVNIFKFLSSEEEKHIKVFQDILKGAQNYEPAESYPGEYFAYMNALASEYVFTQKDKGEQIAKAITTDKEAIEFGIKFEKDSIIFYEGMKKAIPEYDLKVVGQLITQEQGHLKMLIDLKQLIRPI